MLFLYISQIPFQVEAGNYQLKVEGQTMGGTNAIVFQNATDIVFDAKAVSVFIQLSRPIYRQGQTGYSIFRLSYSKYFVSQVPLL